MSPYLSVLVMQVLSSMFKKVECNNELDPFSCGEISVSHIIFADDLMVFLCVDKRNARRLKLLLDEFSSLSGLTIKYHKSEIFFGGATQHHNWIASHLGLNSSALPVTNLGLPLLPKRLSAGSSCAPLI